MRFPAPHLLLVLSAPVAAGGAIAYFGPTPSAQRSRIMATMSIRVPDSLHSAIKDLALKEGYSMNQFLITAAAEKLSSLSTVDYLRARAERADLDAFDRLLKKVPGTPPILATSFLRTSSGGKAVGVLES